MFLKVEVIAIGRHLWANAPSPGKEGVRGNWERKKRSPWTLPLGECVIRETSVLFARQCSQSYLTGYKHRSDGKL